MNVSLDSLDLSEEKRALARREVEKLAHEKWVEAGQPPESPMEFWLQAEREWIERIYVPDRSA